MPDMNDYHAFKSTSGGSGGSSGGGGGKGFGCGWIVIVIVVILLISFIADGARWDAKTRCWDWGFWHSCSSAGYPHKAAGALLLLTFTSILLRLVTLSHVKPLFCTIGKRGVLQ